MKFAFCLFKYFPYGGLQRDFLNIADECVKRGHCVEVFTSSWEGPIPENLKFNVLMVKKAWTNHAKDQSFVKAAESPLAKGGFDAVVGFNKMPGLDIYFAADPCYIDRVYRRKPWYYRITPRYRHFKAYEQAVFGSRCDTRLMMISEREQQLFMRHYQTPAERFHMLPPGVSRDRIPGGDSADVREQWRQEFSLRPEDKVLLMVGSDFKRKGLDRVLLGMASLGGLVRTKTHLIVVGRDDPGKYLRSAKKLGVGGCVRFFPGRDDITRFMLGADLFVHPAYEEAAGIVIIEAIVAGLPVLVTDVCGYAFHVSRAKAGLLVDSPYNQQAFNRKLEVMLTSMDSADWSVNGGNYGRDEDLFSQPRAAAEIIATVGERKRSAKVGGTPSGNI